MNKKIQAARNECVNLSKIEKNIYKNINSVALIILNFPHFFLKIVRAIKKVLYTTSKCKNRCIQIDMLYVNCDVSCQFRLKFFLYKASC